MSAVPYLASPSWLQPGDVAWQLSAATLVGLMSIPGLAVLYGGIVQKRWAVNSALMAFYAFAIVLITWTLWGFKMGFGSPLPLPGPLHYVLGTPSPVLSDIAEQTQAHIPLLTGKIPLLAYPQSTLVYFQFSFAAITPLIFLGGVLGRMNFRAWMLFVPLWSTFIYTVDVFALWGGGWLSRLGAVDYSGGFVIELSAGVTGFVLAAMLGPRLLVDRVEQVPNNMLMVMVGAGLLWLGWNGFDGGGPYFANVNASVAVINTNLAAAAGTLTWLFIDMWVIGKPSLLGAVNGMIGGLVAITAAAGYVDGIGALLIGIIASAIPWYTMNKIALFRKVDDALGVVHTHGLAGLIGGLMIGLVANPHMIVYFGSPAQGTSDISVGGLLYGSGISQLVSQVIAALFVIIFNGIGTLVLVKIVGLLIPLRLTARELDLGDSAVHGEDVGYISPVADRETVLAP